MCIVLILEPLQQQKHMHLELPPHAIWKTEVNTFPQETLRFRLHQSILNTLVNAELLSQLNTETVHCQAKWVNHGSLPHQMHCLIHHETLLEDVAAILIGFKFNGFLRFLRHCHMVNLVNSKKDRSICALFSPSPPLGTYSTFFVICILSSINT